jgi:hypothetical protein
LWAIRLTTAYFYKSTILAIYDSRFTIHDLRGEL